MNENQLGKILVLTELPPSLQSFLRRVRTVLVRALKEILFLLTRSPRFLPHGGPSAVSDSLCRGFKLLGVEYLFNVDDQTAEIICVLSDPAALRYAINRKGNGSAKVLIAGPNVVHNPNTHNKLIQHPLIDRIILPSAWTKDWWMSFSADLKNRVRLWPAGVSADIRASSHTGGVILFIKNEQPGLVLHIEAQLRKAALPVKILRYGTFRRDEYFRALAEAKFMVYLSHTESQGIAVQEAWMADVPTFVWNPGFFDIGGFFWKDSAMSAPYLAPQCGTFFKSTDEFDRGIGAYLQKKSTFSPREYAKEYLSDAVSAAKYLEIIDAVGSL